MGGAIKAQVVSMGATCEEPELDPADEDRCDAELDERCSACGSPVSFSGDRLCRTCEDQEEE